MTGGVIYRLNGANYDPYIIWKYFISKNLIISYLKWGGVFDDTIFSFNCVRTGESVTNFATEITTAIWMDWKDRISGGYDLQKLNVFRSQLLLGNILETQTYSNSFSI